MSIDNGFDSSVYVPEIRSNTEFKIGSSSIASEKHPESNQDALFHFQREGRVIAAVFDGVGGLSHGAEASLKARDSLSDRLSLLPKDADRTSVENVVRSALVSADRDVQGLANEKNTELGTTASVLVISDQSEANSRFAVIGNVGDSRVYLFRDGKLECIILDDNLCSVTQNASEARQIQERLSSATSEVELSEKEKHFYKNRNIVSQSLGGRHSVEPRIYSIEVRDGDRFLITSDGVTDNLTTAEIEALMHQSSGSRDASDSLTRASLTRSRFESFRAKPDDMTAVVIDVPGNEKGERIEQKEEEYNPRVLFEKGSNVKVRRSSGEIDDGWMITGFRSNGDAVVVKPSSEKDGQLLQKIIPQRELEVIVEEDIARAESFDELKKVISGVSGLQGSSNKYKSSELIEIIDLIRTGEASLENITKSGGLREKVSWILALEKTRGNLAQT